MMKNIGIWIDRRKAVIVEISSEKEGVEPKDKETITFIESGVEKHIRLSGGSGTRKTPYGPQDISVDSKIDDRRKQQLSKYYRDIIRNVRDAHRIFIFGLGQAKIELEKEIKKSKELALKVLPIETVDKMTEKQITAKVRNFFGSRK